jgi:(2Fe-2S) ferredoxin
MKQCKAGPNVVMPDKTRYTRIDAEEIPTVLDKHFQTESPSEPTQPLPTKLKTLV